MSLSRILAAAALAAAALAPSAARAQAEGGSYVLRVGNDTVAVETFSRTPGRLQADVAARGRARIRFDARTAADGSVSTLEFRVWGWGAPDSAAPLQRGTVTLAGDTARVEGTAAGASATTAIGGARGAVVVVNPSAALIEQMLMRARALGGRDSVSFPVIAPGAPNALTARVRWIGADSAALLLGSAEVRARTDAAGRLLGGSIPSQRLVIDRVAATLSTAAERPDYSAPAGAPYTAEEVRVPNGAFQLAGTLTLPKARAGRVAAVVTITGSGQQDRDEAIPGVRGYRLFRQVADTLTRRGIAVLRMDDRGFGASGGDARNATSADFMTDVAAAVAYLRTRPEIDPDRIALVGHSEGGLIGPAVAARDPRIRAVAVLAGPSRTGSRILQYQVRYGVEHDTTVAPAARDSALRKAAVTLDSMVAASAWFRWFWSYDPLPAARQVRQPVLVLQGGSDRQVTPDQAPELAAAIRAAGNRDVTVRVFPDLNHLFLLHPSGTPAEYASLPDTRVPPRVLGTLADWLAARLR